MESIVLALVTTVAIAALVFMGSVIARKRN
jgi:hypothetical protein